MRNQNLSVATAAIALGLSGIIFSVALAWAFVSLDRHDEIRPNEPGVYGSKIDLGDTHPEVTTEMIAQAVAAAPFERTRRIPEMPYSLDDQSTVGSTTQPDSALFSFDGLTLLGTVAAADAGVAVIQRSDERPIVVGVGESIDSFVVTAVNRAEVVLSSRGADVTLALQEASVRANADAALLYDQMRAGFESVSLSFRSTNLSFTTQDLSFTTQPMTFIRPEPRHRNDPVAALR